MNKNMSASYKEAYGQEAHPDFGTSIPAGKNRPDDKDTLTAKHSVEQVRQAQAVEGRVKKALDQQCGRGTPEGGRLGNNCPQPETGVSDTPPSVKFKQ